MKIVLVSDEQFQRLHEVIRVQNRFVLDNLPVPNLYMAEFQTVVLPRNAVQISDYPKDEELRLYRIAQVAFGMKEQV